MAQINGQYIFVETETLNTGTEGTEHPIESGEKITDHINPIPKTISVSGEIIGDSVKDMLLSCMKQRKLVNYKGINTLQNAQIESVKFDSSSDIKGGYKVDLELKEIKVVKAAKKKQTKSTTERKNNVGTQQKQSNTPSKTPVYHTVKKGDSRWSMSKKYGTTIDFITKNNNVKKITTNGTWYGLKVGAKVVVGYR